jgi:hypothetical protein
MADEWLVLTARAKARLGIARGVGAGGPLLAYPNDLQVVPSVCWAAERDSPSHACLIVRTPSRHPSSSEAEREGLIHRSAWKKRNSRKFAVTSERRFGLQGCRSLRTLPLPDRIEGKFVGFVARDCYEQWRLATLQLPEKFSKERHLP